MSPSSPIQHHPAAAKAPAPTSAPALRDKDVYLFDTTLRDGEQAEGVNFSLRDKIKIAHLLDDFGMDYIEGGWPGSNPKAVDFFKAVQNEEFKQARLVAFGSTRRKETDVAEDPQIAMLLEARTPVVCIFGKSWTLQVTDALRTTFEENLAMIGDSVSFLRAAGREVVYDAEHFFDGYKADSEYALSTLKAARDAGAGTIVLCDTNGGTMPFEISRIVGEVHAALNEGDHEVPVGIHAHDDSGCGVANSLAAIMAGASHVQGTINGYGERCGNANLTSIIPNLILKLGKTTLDADQLKELSNLSHAVDEIANLVPNIRAPFVGRAAFAHKGGIHVSAIRRNRATYEHIEPEAVGNETRVLVSELSGVSNLASVQEMAGAEDQATSNETMREALNRIKRLENEGYSFEAAEASLHLLLEEAQGRHAPHFELLQARSIIEKHGHNEDLVTEATVKVRVGERVDYRVAEGDGPVDALANALKDALAVRYPAIREVKLLDFKVRVIDAEHGTAAKVRVLINSGREGEKSWSTVGVSENLIQASWQALVDSYEYFLLRSEAVTNLHSDLPAAVVV